MYKIKTLKNGFTVITANLPYLDSVTTLVAVGSGSRSETKQNNGVSHFLEHMFFKGSEKYPSTEALANIIDGIGAANNAATSKEYTYYWIKSASKHLPLAVDILASMLKEPLLDAEEVEKEKGVIIEELRMYKDHPASLAGELYERLQFGDQPLGWNIGGEEETVKQLSRKDLQDYLATHYVPENMAIIFAGNLPEKVEELAEQYFADIPQGKVQEPVAFQPLKQKSHKVAVNYKKIDQVNLILGTPSVDRYSDKRYAQRLLAIILGGGMSSRLFLQVRERRGLAYHISAGYDIFKDAGAFTVFAGLKASNIEEGLKVIIDELKKIATEPVSAEELQKAKEMIRGRQALSRESTNFLAEYAGLRFVLDHKVETFEEYLEKIDQVTAIDIQNLAKELFLDQHFTLQILGPVKDKKPFEAILNS